MTYAMCPDDGLPRLYRYVDGLPDNLICRLNKTLNLLEIDRTKFDALTKTEKHIVRRTQAEVVYADAVLRQPTGRFNRYNEAAE